MSESSDKPPQPGFEFPAEYAQGIAQITACWAVLESNINMAIWHMAGIYPAIGACMTEQIFNLDNRLKALSALITLRKGPKALLNRVNQFFAAARKAGDIRNKIIHHTWHRGSESGEMLQLEIGAKGTLTYGFKPISIDQLRADEKTVRQAMTEAVEIRNATEAALSTLPEIPLSELHPTVLHQGGSPITRSSDKTFVLFPPEPLDELQEARRKALELSRRYPPPDDPKGQ